MFHYFYMRGYKLNRTSPGLSVPRTLKLPSREISYDVKAPSVMCDIPDSEDITGHRSIVMNDVKLFESIIKSSIYISSCCARNTGSGLYLRHSQHFFHDRWGEV